MRQQIQTGGLELLFAVQHDPLLLATERLLSCDTCAEDLLAEASELAQLARVTAGFEYLFTIRTVVRLAIAHLQSCCESGKNRALLSRAGDTRSVMSLMRELPWPERMAFFLREILSYSRRDSSLLLGMSDAHVDQMPGRALRRIASGNETRLDTLKAWYRGELFEFDSVAV